MKSRFISRVHILYKQQRSLAILTLLCLLLAFPLLLLAAPHAATLSDKTASSDAIAYVDGTSWDQIRLVNPDGSGDRLLWSHGKSDPDNVYQIERLAWRPQHNELSFESSHEKFCSINDHDIFAIRADGSGYRRITQAPACGALASYPQGTVQVPVTNGSFSYSFSGFIYFQGASGPQMVNLPPGGSTTVTFPQVADFGAGLQIAGFGWGSWNRAIALASAVDVQTNTTVTTGPVSIYGGSFDVWEVSAPTWRFDGGKMSYIHNFTDLFQIDPEPAALAQGDQLPFKGDEVADYVRELAWGPTAATANQLLYVAVSILGPERIYLLDLQQVSSTPGEQLLQYSSSQNVRSLSWLPDASGFVFSLDEESWGPANLFRYDFATKNVTRLTDFSDAWAGRASVSPDGQQVVFEYATDALGTRRDLVDPSLWIVDISGDNLHMLLPSGRLPAWGLPVTPEPPPPTGGGDFHIYLPGIRS